MKTRTTRNGTIHYLECVDCGVQKTTVFQRQKPRCRSCGRKKLFEDKSEGMRECRVCGETKPKTSEHFSYKDKQEKRLDRVCKPCDNKRRQERRARAKVTSAAYYQKNAEELKAKARARRKTPEAKERARERMKELRKDPVFRVSTNVSRAVRYALNGQHKYQKTFDKLPYTQEQLKEHLENQFDDKMTWDNYGSYWHIDHIYPQSRLPYDSLEHPNFQKCWSLDNLQPLEAKANIRKGDKIDD